LQGAFPAGAHKSQYSDPTHFGHPDGVSLTASLYTRVCATVRHGPTRATGVAAPRRASGGRSSGRPPRPPSTAHASSTSVTSPLRTC